MGSALDWACSRSKSMAGGHVQSSAAAGGAALPVPKGEKRTQGERSNLFAVGSTIATSIVSQVRWSIAETSLIGCQWPANLGLWSRTSSISYPRHLLRSYGGSSAVLVASSCFQPHLPLNAHQPAVQDVYPGMPTNTIKLGEG